jgi:hypothetical protein
MGRDGYEELKNELLTEPEDAGKYVNRP